MNKEMEKFSVAPGIEIKKERGNNEADDAIKDAVKEKERKDAEWREKYKVEGEETQEDLLLKSAEETTEEDITAGGESDDFEEIAEKVERKADSKSQKQGEIKTGAVGKLERELSKKGLERKRTTERKEEIELAGELKKDSEKIAKPPVEPITEVEAKNKPVEEAAKVIEGEVIETEKETEDEREKELTGLMEGLDDVIEKLEILKDGDTDDFDTVGKMILATEDFYEKKNRLMELKDKLANEDKQDEVIAKINEGVSLYTKIRKKLREIERAKETEIVEGEVYKLNDYQFIDMVLFLGPGGEGRWNTALLCLESVIADEYKFLWRDSESYLVQRDKDNKSARITFSNKDREKIAVVDIDFNFEEKSISVNVEKMPEQEIEIEEDVVETEGEQETVGEEGPKISREVLERLERIDDRIEKARRGIEEIEAGKESVEVGKEDSEEKEAGDTVKSSLDDLRIVDLKLDKARLEIDKMEIQLESGELSSEEKNKLERAKFELEENKRKLLNEQMKVAEIWERKLKGALLHREYKVEEAEKKIGGEKKDILKKLTFGLLGKKVAEGKEAAAGTLVGKEETPVSVLTETTEAPAMETAPTKPEKSWVYRITHLGKMKREEKLGRAEKRIGEAGDINGLRELAKDCADEPKFNKKFKEFFGEFEGRLESWLKGEDTDFNQRENEFSELAKKLGELRNNNEISEESVMMASAFFDKAKRICWTLNVPEVEIPLPAEDINEVATENLANEGAESEREDEIKEMSDEEAEKLISTFLKKDELDLGRVNTPDGLKELLDSLHKEIWDFLEKNKMSRDAEFGLVQVRGKIETNNFMEYFGDNASPERVKEWFGEDKDLTEKIKLSSLRIYYKGIISKVAELYQRSLDAETSASEGEEVEEGK